jgi:hypothetical protein
MDATFCVVQRKVGWDWTIASFVWEFLVGLRVLGTGIVPEFGTGEIPDEFRHR